MAPKAYKKRPGTSGIRGHLYETKLISLFVFRATHSDQIEEFHLGSNVDEIGAFDDICFRIKFHNSDRSLAVFVQAKHRENTSVVTLKNKNDIIKYFDSYLKIRHAMKIDNRGVLFNGHYDDIDCVFIIYTTSSGDFVNKFESNFASKLNDLICTGGNAFHFPYDNESVQYLRKNYIKEQMRLLGISVASYLRDNEYTEEKSLSRNGHQNIFSDKHILQYHAILAERVMEISDKQQGEFRLAIFSDDFFHTNEEFLTTFRDSLYKEVLKWTKFSYEEIALFLKSALVDNWSLTPLYGSVFTYNKGQLEFYDKKTPDELKRVLNQVKVSESEFITATYVSARSMLANKVFQVPATFGNKDLTIRGNDDKIERRLELLSSKLSDLLEQCQGNNVICVNESLGKGFLQSNGGLSSAVGNLLVLDENSKLMKFTDNPQMLGDLARRLFEKLQKKHADMQQYRFDIKVENFPKLVFECSDHENDLVEDFTSKFLCYTDQADEGLVEDILKGEIEGNQINIDKIVRVRSDAIFSTYHNAIQKWWMSKSGTYLTKQESPYLTIKKIIKDPVLSAMTIIYKNEVKGIDSIFNKDLLTDEEDILNTIISTENSALSVAKVLQIIKNRGHYLIDVEYILQLPVDECYKLLDEIKNVNGSDLLVFICERLPKLTKHKKTLENIAKIVKDKTVIVVTIPTCVEIIKNIFSHIHKIQHEKPNLSELSENSRNIILNKSHLVFQDINVSLSLIVDEVSIQYIEGQALKEILSEKTVAQLGKSLGNSNYEEIKHLYVKRRVRCGGKPSFASTSNQHSDDNDVVVDDFDDDGVDDENNWKHNNVKVIDTLHDLKDEVVLVTAKPGMGKSTLLTHISLQTKILEPRVWIVRVNLLDHAKDFSIWQENNQSIDILQCLKFLCQLVVSKKTNKMTIDLEENNGVINLKKCTTDDDWTVFELKLFLHFFNTRKLIFLFDGYDEICPHYTNEVLLFLKTLRNYHKKHQIWIASRSYNQIKSLLHREFGTSYEILHFSYQEKIYYLEKYWKSNLVMTELDIAQLENIYDFMKFMSKALEDSNMIGSMYKLQNLPLFEVYFSALDYFIALVNYTHIPLWTFDKWNTNLLKEIFARLRIRYNGDSSEKNIMHAFVRTPLHLYLMADYFRNEIINVSKNPNKWELDINTYIIYERFLETKLKIIRFQEKNKWDIYNPDLVYICEKERADFIAKHKRLAAYAIFHSITNNSLFSQKELEEIKNMIELIKEGGEKTGLIYSVASNNIPIFVHRTFAEYFAVEYFCDLLKQEEDTSKQKSLIRFIFKVIFFECFANVSNILDTKLLVDNILHAVLNKHGKYIFDLLMDCSDSSSQRFTNNYNDIEEFEDDNISILNYALSNKLSSFLRFFFSLMEIHLNKDNLQKFIAVILSRNMFVKAIIVKCDEFIIFALDIVRKIDLSRFNCLFSSEHFSFFINFTTKSNEEILNLFRTIVNFTSETIKPYYMYDPDVNNYVWVTVRNHIAKGPTISRISM